jgi:uncharacterized protein YcbX
MNSIEVIALYRYPVKGFSPEPLERAEIPAGGTMPFDRAFAIENGPSGFDPQSPGYFPKSRFLMLMRDERMAEFSTRFDERTGVFRIARNGSVEVEGSLTTAEGRQEIEVWIAENFREELRGPPKILSADGHSFSDKKAKVLHLINLASVRALSERLGRAVDPLRFRPNILVDGAPAFAELEWEREAVRLPGLVLKGESRTGRCAATNVDPQSGRRDMEIPRALDAIYGHKDFGIYLVAKTGGTIAVGDEVSVPAGKRAGHPLPEGEGVAEGDGGGGQSLWREASNPSSARFAGTLLPTGERKGPAGGGRPFGKLRRKTSVAEGGERRGAVRRHIALFACVSRLAALGARTTTPATRLARPIVHPRSRFDRRRLRGLHGLLGLRRFARLAGRRGVGELWTIILLLLGAVVPVAVLVAVARAAPIIAAVVIAMLLGTRTVAAVVRILAGVEAVLAAAAAFVAADFAVIVEAIAPVHLTVVVVTLIRTITVLRLRRLELRLRGHDDAVVVLGVLQIALHGDNIAGGLRVARERRVFVGDMRRGAADLHVRAIRFKAPRERIGPLAVVAPAGPAILIVPHEPVLLLTVNFPIRPDPTPLKGIGLSVLTPATRLTSAEGPKSERLMRWRRERTSSRRSLVSICRECVPALWLHLVAAGSYPEIPTFPSAFLSCP